MEFNIKGLGSVRMNVDSVTFSKGYEGELSMKDACSLLYYYTFNSVLICLFGSDLFFEVDKEEREMWSQIRSKEITSN